MSLGRLRPNKDNGDKKYPTQSNLTKHIQDLAASAAIETTKSTVESFTADIRDKRPDTDPSEYGSEILNAAFLSSHIFIKTYIESIERQIDVITSSLIITSQGLDPRKMDWETVQKTAEKIVDENDAEWTKEGKERK